MADPRDFDFWVEDDRLHVRHVTARLLTRISSGQNTGADYGDKVISLLRGDTRRSLRGYLLHELGHYLCDRLDHPKRGLTQEDACDLLSWVPNILLDDRNGPLRAYLGLKEDA